MENQSAPISQNTDKFSRFQVYLGETEKNGRVKKTKSVGMAYHREGQTMMTLRLWMLLQEKFYLVLNQNDASKYLIMTREPSKNPNSKNKYFWNIVGNGMIDTVQGIIRLQFDLLEKSVYVNIYPEPSVTSATLPPPEVEEAA